MDNFCGTAAHVFVDVSVFLQQELNVLVPGALIRVSVQYVDAGVAHPVNHADDVFIVAATVTVERVM